MKALLLVAAALVIVVSFTASPVASLESPAATYSRDTLHVAIPYTAPQSGSGLFTIEVLNPEDEVLARSERRLRVAAGEGQWDEDLKLAKTLPVEDLAWHRVRYRFRYQGREDAAISGTESISQILRMPVIHILGQQLYMAGGPAAVRVIVTDSRDAVIDGAGTLRIELNGRALFTGRLNRRGTAEAQFRFPSGISGQQSMRYIVETSIGSAEFTQQVRVQDSVSVLLTTEKPIYQPGQTIHVRALALDRASHEAAAGRNLIFEVEDPRGNRVFKRAVQTSRFGIASAEFGLADEVNLGTYHLRAVTDNESGKAAEIALDVERYVLPKFKVAVEFAGKAKHGYRPGEHVTGTVRANYFFGKPVDQAEVTVRASGADVTIFEAASVQGKTDAGGAYRFDLKLPDYLAGRPLNQGAARMLIEASVKDGAGHIETRGEPVTVSQSPLLVTAVPEGGTLIPHLENQVFLLTSYADGQPASATLTVRAAGSPEQSVTTGTGGVGIVRVNGAAETLTIEAKDSEGNRVSSSVTLKRRAGDDQILLRTERAVYRAGDRMQLRVFSTKTRGTAYVDVIKSGQTVLTRDLEIVNGQAELTVPVTPDLAGTLDCNAYLFGRDARPVADHRLIFVQPADELKIAAETDAPQYKPGEEARIRFRVTNSHGEGVQAALGLQVVDEAVFALAEKQPGFAKIFFYLEQELMKPRYEIHSISMAGAIETADQGARALFAATEVVNPNRFQTQFGRTVPQTKYPEYAGRYQARFLQQVRGVTQATAKIRDAWDKPIEITAASSRYLLARSAGPDRHTGTVDDLWTYIDVRNGKTVTEPGTGEIDVELEHERGPFNGLAEIAGTVKDTGGNPVFGATVTVLERAGGKTRTTRTDGAGQFRIAAIPAGQYQVQVAASGFRMVMEGVALNARDRAVVSASLASDRMTRIKVGGNLMAGVAGGVPGGVMGGIIGGVARQFDEARLVAMPAAAPVKKEMAPSSVTGFKDSSDKQAPRVRSYFPEALYINPEIITDHRGIASIVIPMADSITTWRMALVASTATGALGSGTASLKVFQDFFVDLDLPVTLTQGDRVSIPVAVYNYAASRGDVNLRLQEDDWFGLVGDTADKTVAVESGRVGGSQFTVEAKRIGKFKLTLSARMNGNARRADIVVREIEVVPNGREQNLVFNGRRETAVRHEVNFPAAAIRDAGKIFVRLYPGPLSQVIEGMDSILRMPGGCFEQTSSSTYPNVLALDYMKRTGKLTPEVRAKAEAYIANGYQRLLTFEVPGGGFSWFGNPPANKILTAYGLMEFSDMSKVYDVDPKVIARTQAWLAGQQQADGRWQPDTSFINEGATNRYNTNVLRITAYIAWSLQNTGHSGPAVEKARQFIAGHLDGSIHPYTLAVLANFAADYAKDRAFTTQLMRMLLDARTQKGEQVWWNAEETGVYATGESAAVETTGLAVQALLKWGGDAGTAAKALNYIASRKDASGAWRTTQATIMALRALLLASSKSAADVRGTVEITLNGKPAERLTLTPENNDLFHQFALKNVDSSGVNAVEVRFTGTGSLAYQVAGRYFVPWNDRTAKEPLSITVDYDRTRLAQDDIATATANIRNNLGKVANMVMVDLGIPPGFDLLAEDLQAFQEKTAARSGGKLEKFSLTATQAILYFDSLPAGAKVEVKFRLRAKYPIKARTFLSRVYEYYDPEVGSVARPEQLEVRKK
jgi:uncharacterized protein YfaS (alpha-2-macroglobulin family)